MARIPMQRKPFPMDWTPEKCSTARKSFGALAYKCVPGHMYTAVHYKLGSLECPRAVLLLGQGRRGGQQGDRRRRRLHDAGRLR
eukprot:8770030-Alexandrium_andersonii.AAC.1